MLFQGVIIQPLNVLQPSAGRIGADAPLREWIFSRVLELLENKSKAEDSKSCLDFHADWRPKLSLAYLSLGNLFLGIWDLNPLN